MTSRSSFFVGALCILALLANVHAKTAQEWKSRVIYQVLTDRFARSDGSKYPCNNLGDYCGGTFRGLINELDYISNMGFNAIWISPVVDNTPGGYHGYWMSDLYKINPHFGSEQDFKDLIKACHDRDIWMMVDVVANHAGVVDMDFSQINPFNQGNHYHSKCQISQSDFETYNQQNIEYCRLANLPDLDQNNPYVRSTLLSWVKDFVSKYNIDGLRIDTVPEVPKDFWADFQNAAGVYAVGEVFNGRLDYVAGYQGPLNALLNYPLYYAIRDAFQWRKDIKQSLSNFLPNMVNSFKDVSVLGVFVDNHDNARFLNGQSDRKLYQNALTMALTTVGIPIVYYGTEQYYGGGNDPANRETLWTHGSDTEAYTFIQKLVQLRKSSNDLISAPQVERWASNNLYVYTRGNVLVALTNAGSNGGTVQQDINNHPYKDGTVLCNIFWAQDCVTVTNGKVGVVLMNGESKVFVPKTKVTGSFRTSSAFI